MNLALSTPNNLIVVGIGEMKISQHPDDVLVTYALGSCIALSLYDPIKKIGGLIHCKLPRKGDYTPRANINNYTFVDTGVFNMLHEIAKLGALKTRLIAKVVGAAGMMDENNYFRIGRQNYEAMCEILNALNILPRSIKVGGKEPRTLYLYLNTGKTIIKTPHKTYEI